MQRIWEIFYQCEECACILRAYFSQSVIKEKFAFEHVESTMVSEVFYQCEECSCILCAYFSQSVINKYEICDVLVPFFYLL